MALVQNPPYICGPLTELTLGERPVAQAFYTQLADICAEVLGVRGWVPHEHYDPLAHKDFTPEQVYEAEHNIVCHQTSLLVVCAIGPSWGGGMEVAWAEQHRVPGVLLCHATNLRVGKISRLLRGSPIFHRQLFLAPEDDAILAYTDLDGAARCFKEWLGAVATVNGRFFLRL